MLKMSTGVYGPWRVKCEMCEKGAIRSSGFAVQNISNLGHQTLTPLARPACLARLSWRSVLLFCHTGGPSKGSCANI